MVFLSPSLTCVPRSTHALSSPLCCRHVWVIMCRHLHAERAESKPPLVPRSNTLEIMGPASVGMVMLYSIDSGLSLLPLFKEKEACGCACPALRLSQWTPRGRDFLAAWVHFNMAFYNGVWAEWDPICQDILCRHTQEDFLEHSQSCDCNNCLSSGLQLSYSHFKAQELMCDGPYLLIQTYKAISGPSSKGGAFSYSFFFLVFLTTGKEILFMAEYDPSSKNSKAPFPIESA